MIVSPKSFSWPVRVYWEDTDAGGLVYHASYLRFLERARTEWLRSIGIEQEPLRIEQHTAFVVRELSLEFLKSAKLDDLLEITVMPGELKNASFTCLQQIVQTTHATVLVSATVRVACIDPIQLQPKRIPNYLLKLLKEIFVHE